MLTRCAESSVQGQGYLVGGGALVPIHLYCSAIMDFSHDLESAVYRIPSAGINKQMSVCRGQRQQFPAPQKTAVQLVS